MLDRQNLLVIKNIHHTFGQSENQLSVLNDVNFTVPDNTFNIIFGASGSGKSTLLNILTGLQKPSKGTVLFSGNDIYKLTADELAYFRAHRIGIVYQQNHWIQSLSVLENVAMPLYFMGYSRRLAAEMALVALERVGMLAYAPRHPALLSGGEQQRIGMARAIVNDPLVIVADEPTGNLDSENGDKIMDLLRRFHQDMRRTIILVTHNMEYLPLADQLLHIVDGKLQSRNDAKPEVIAKDLLKDLDKRISTMISAKNKKSEHQNETK